MNSVWLDDAQRPRFSSLTQSIKTDVLIIGGGLAGLLCAYRLKKAGVDCALVEATEICGGITKNTTAKITVQHGAIYDKMIRRFGSDRARLYFEAQTEAGREYARLCKSIPCDYETKESFVYSIDDRARMEREAAALTRLGAEARFVVPETLPFRVSGAVCVADQAQFHPLKFAFEIAKGLNIYENTKVTELMPNKAVTDKGEISCERMIVATHFPILNKHGAYFLKLYQHRSYVLALRGAADVGGMYVDEADTGLSFRNYGDLLLLGGGSHRTGKKGGGFRELENVAKRYYGGAVTVGRWATQDCMSLDGIPYIGQYARATSDLYVATGFNKWGMTSSMVSAMVLTDLVLGRESEYAEVFSPSRSMLRPQLVKNVLESVVGLVTPTAPRCPHMGCALKYNEQEHT